MWVLVIITSETEFFDAPDLYKSRDAPKNSSGKITFLGDRTMRCQTNEALHAKIFIEFVALIIWKPDALPAQGTDAENTSQRELHDRACRDPRT